MARQTLIFFSYAHKDFEPLLGEDTSWLAEVQDRIKRAIGANNDRVPFKVWTDRSGLVAGQRIEATIEPALAECDVAVAFVSRHYLYSPGCADELRVLHRLGKPIIVIEMVKDWHLVPGTELGDLGHQLHSVDRLRCARFWTEVDGGTDLVASPRPSRAGPRDTERLQELLTEVKRAIELHAGPAAAPAPRFVTDLSDPVAPVAPHDLFLAWSTRDAQKHAMRLKRSLEDKGYSVACFDLTAPEGLDGWTTDTLQERIAASHHYAQIVGAVPGKPDLFGSGQSLVAAQYEAAMRAGTETSLMLAPEVYAEDCGPEHSAFLDGCDCQPTTVEAFEQYLIKSIDAARATAASARRRTARLDELPDMNGKLIAIDFDPATDRDKFDLLALRLTRHDNIAIADTITDDASRDVLRTTVAENDAVLVVYSANEASQIRAKRHFKDFWRFCQSQKTALCRLAIGDAAPDAVNPCPVGRGIHRIRVHDEVDEGDLNDFLLALGIGPEVDTALAGE